MKETIYMTMNLNHNIDLCNNDRKFETDLLCCD